MTTSTQLETVVSRPATVWGAAERVELSERFFRGIFTGVVLFVGLTALASLALLPLRDGLGWAAAPTVGLTAGLVIACPLALRRARVLYMHLRRDPRWEFALAVVAAALVAYPLASQLWWPACVLLVMIAIVAPFSRTLAYCLGVLAVNLGSHLIAGDLSETPTVNVVGLWIGLIFWPAALGLLADHLSRHVLRLREPGWQDVEERPRRVTAIQHDEDRKAASEVDRQAVAGLTARQAQVVALLAGGMQFGEIAAQLSISIRQVHRHVSAAAARLGTPNTYAMVAVAIRAGLAPEQRTDCPDEPR